MKKLLALAAVILLSGCSEASPGTPEKLVGSPFIMTADYSRGAAEGAVSFTYNGVESNRTEFLSPDAVCGLAFEIEGADVTLKYKGVESRRDISELKQRGAAAALCRFFTDLSAELPAGETQKNGDVLYTLSDGGSMTVYGGAIKSITIPRLDIEFKITGFETS